MKMRRGEVTEHKQVSITHATDNGKYQRGYGNNGTNVPLNDIGLDFCQALFGGHGLFDAGHILP